MKKKLENRREFLKKVCPTIAFAFFGLSFLEACSTEGINLDVKFLKNLSKRTRLIFSFGL